MLMKTLVMTKGEWKVWKFNKRRDVETLSCSELGSWSIKNLRNETFRTKIFKSNNFGSEKSSLFSSKQVAILCEYHFTSSNTHKNIIQSNFVSFLDTFFFHSYTSFPKMNWMVNCLQSYIRKLKTLLSGFIQL